MMIIDGAGITMEETERTLDTGTTRTIDMMIEGARNIERIRMSLIAAVVIEMIAEVVLGMIAEVVLTMAEGMTTATGAETM